MIKSKIVRMYAKGAEKRVKRARITTARNTTSNGK
jgi:hypothetical protein